MVTLIINACNSHSAHEDLVLMTVNMFNSFTTTGSFLIPFITTHPNVSISAFRQTMEIGAEPQNEFSKVIKTLQNSDHKKINYYLQFLLFTRYLIPHREMNIRDGRMILERD